MCMAFSLWITMSWLCAGTYLLGKDTYGYALANNMKHFLSSKWVKAYNEDVWIHADLHLNRFECASARTRYQIKHN